MAEQFPVWADIHDNFETLGAVTEKKFTVPAGKRWLVFGGRAERDVSAAFDAFVYNETDNLIGNLFDQVVAGVTEVLFGGLRSAYRPFPMKAGWYIKYVWGVEQVTPEVALMVTETPR